MDFVVWLKRGVWSLVLGLVLLVAAGPWGLYWWGLQSVPGRPEVVAPLASMEAQRLAWDRAGGEGELEMVSLNPVSYVMSAAGQSVPPPSTLFAWRVASDYTLKHLGTPGKWRWNLATTALTIWITRHWSLAELLTAVVRQDEAMGRKP